MARQPQFNRSTPQPQPPFSLYDHIAASAVFSTYLPSPLDIRRLWPPTVPMKHLSSFTRDSPQSLPIRSSRHRASIHSLSDVIGICPACSDNRKPHTVSHIPCGSVGSHRSYIPQVWNLRVLLICGKKWVRNNDLFPGSLLLLSAGECKQSK